MGNSLGGRIRSSACYRCYCLVPSLACFTCQGARVTCLVGVSGVSSGRCRCRDPVSKCRARAQACACPGWIPARWTSRRSPASRSAPCSTLSRTTCSASRSPSTIPRHRPPVPGVGGPRTTAPFCGKTPMPPLLQCCATRSGKVSVLHQVPGLGLRRASLQTPPLLMPTDADKGSVLALAGQGACCKACKKGHTPNNGGRRPG